MMLPIKIIVVEDQRVIRASLKLLIQNNPQTEVVGEASNGREVLDLLKKIQCHIVLLDLEMPVMDGQEALTQIITKFKDTKVVILSGNSDPGIIHSCIKAGANAYLNKNCSENTLLEALHTVHEKGRWFGEDVANILLSESQLPAPKNSLQILKSLSERENDIVRLLCKGKNEKQIARELNISHHTVHTHRTHIYQKVGVNNLADLMNYALKSGWYHVSNN